MRAQSPAPEPEQAKANTTAALLALRIGLESYKERFGEYPSPNRPAEMAEFNGKAYPIGGALMLYQALTGDGDTEIRLGVPGKNVSDGVISKDELKNAVVDLPKTLISKLKDGRYIVVDGAGLPVQYKQEGGVSEVSAVEAKP